MPSTEVKKMNRGRMVLKILLWAWGTGLTLVVGLIVFLLVREIPQPRAYEFTLNDFSVQFTRTSGIIFEPALVASALTSVSGSAETLTVHPCKDQMDDKNSSTATDGKDGDPPDSGSGVSAPQPAPNCPTYKSATAIRMSPKSEKGSLRDVMMTFNGSNEPFKLHGTTSKFGIKMDLVPTESSLSLSFELRNGADADLSFNFSGQRKKPTITNGTSLRIKSSQLIEFLFEPQENAILTDDALSHVATLSGELREAVEFPLRRGYLCRAQKGTRIYLSSDNWRFQELTTSKDGNFVVGLNPRDPALSICEDTLEMDGHKACSDGTISVCKWDWIGYLKWVN